MLKHRCLILLFCGAFFMTGCATTVLKQDIPVSTNPMGAKIFANGQYVGQTPCTVSLERTRNHILTLVKQNYRQEDVVISQQYQSDRVLTNAVLEGVDSAMFFKDTKMGISRSMMSVNHQEATGEAYILYPPAVKVSLVPLDGSQSSARVPERGDVESYGADSRSSSGGRGFSAGDAVKAGVVAGAIVGAAQAKPIEKKWETSSSTKTYVQPDGTVVTKKSKTSVGVGVNPAGLAEALGILFK